MLYNVEKCTLNIYRSRVIYFVTLVATLELKIESRGKKAQTKGGSLGTKVLRSDYLCCSSKIVDVNHG